LAKSSNQKVVRSYKHHRRSSKKDRFRKYK
jgi:hypothetical protein